jgi:hypothetical protein
VDLNGGHRGRTRRHVHGSLFTKEQLPARFALRTATAEPAAATATVASAATVAAEAAAATATPFLRASLIDVQTTAFEILLIQRLACCAAGVVVCHFDESKSTRAASDVIAHEMHGLYRAVRREQLLELWLLSVE